MCYKCDPEPAWLGVEGAGTCGAWLDRIQISSQAASVSHPPPPGLHRLPHPVMRGERGCDVRMSRVSPGPHCHIVRVTLLPHLPGPGVGWEVVAGAGYHQSRDRSQPRNVSEHDPVPRFSGEPGL